MEFIQDNWAEIALAIVTFAGTITALTNSTVDDKFVDIVKRIITAIVLGKMK